MSIPIKILTYNPKYPKLFKKEKELILKSLNDSSIYVEHIGSTAVPGLSGKPIIDIMIGVDSLDDVNKHVELLKEIGYTSNPNWDDDYPEKRALDKRLNNTEIYIFIIEFNAEFWVKRLLFRDYLRDYPKVAKEYTKLKMDLAKKYQHDREAYLKGKSKFIKEVVKKAKKKYKQYST
ncbi:MAG: GrpB family protein [Asgard group archaeon]|nr:GrpB family protein [Asgard group archaeon]